MSAALRSFFLVLLFGLIMTIQMNLDSDKTATRQIKNSLELAVHDASLALDQTQLVRGKVIFDQAQARKNLIASLQYQLKLNHTLTPVAGSYYQQPFVIKELLFIDEATLDPAKPGQPITFPYVFQQSQYKIVELLHGPSIVAVIETKSPRYFTGEPITIRQAVVYEYR